MKKWGRIAGKVRDVLVYKALGDSVINRGGAGEVNLIDVGSVGMLPLPWRRHPRSIRSLLRFEPREADSQDGPVTRLGCALWSAEGRREFRIYGGGGGDGSSFLRQNIEYVQANWSWLSTRGPERLARTILERMQLERVEMVECRTLDGVLEDQATRFGFLKIDAQGGELEILKGAEKFLKRDCVGLQLELFALPMYKGVPLIDEVRGFLSARGFDLVMAYPPHGTFDSQHDCVFLRRGEESRELMAIKRVYGLV